MFRIAMLVLLLSSLVGCSGQINQANTHSVQLEGSRYLGFMGYVRYYDIEIDGEHYIVADKVDQAVSICPKSKPTNAEQPK